MQQHASTPESIVCGGLIAGGDPGSRSSDRFGESARGLLQSQVELLEFGYICNVVE